MRLSAWTLPARRVDMAAEISGTAFMAVGATTRVTGATKALALTRTVAIKALIIVLKVDRDVDVVRHQSEAEASRLEHGPRG